MEELTKQCLSCGKTFSKSKRTSLKKWNTTTKYCSPECYRKHGSPYKEGHKPHNTGKQHLLGEENPNWKGDNVGYVALHSWVNRTKKKKGVCEHCKKIGVKTVNANKTGLYLRNIEDWLELCYQCHLVYDKDSVGEHRYFETTLRKYRNL